MAPTVVADVKTELLAIRAKVDEAIAHVESGVSNLNEDQIDALGKLVDDIEGEAYDAGIRIARLLGRAESAEKFSGVVKQIVSELRDENGTGGVITGTEPTLAILHPGESVLPTAVAQQIEQAVSADSAPSADDLDKVAEEQAAGEATGTTTA